MHADPAHPVMSPMQPPIEESVSIMKVPSQHPDLPTLTPSPHHFHIITHGPCHVSWEGGMRAKAMPGSTHSIVSCEQLTHST